MPKHLANVLSPASLRLKGYMISGGPDSNIKLSQSVWSSTANASSSVGL